MRESFQQERASCVCTLHQFKMSLLLFIHDIMKVMPNSTQKVNCLIYTQFGSYICLLLREQDLTLFWAFHTDINLKQTEILIAPIKLELQNLWFKSIWQVKHEGKLRKLADFGGSEAVKWSCLFQHVSIQGWTGTSSIHDSDC